MNTSVTASEVFSRRTAGASSDNACTAASDAIFLARNADFPVKASITAFGCPCPGEIHPKRVVEIAERLSVAGADEVVLANTISVAASHCVRRLLGAVHDATPPKIRLGIHVYDTRDSGLANVYSRIVAGARIIDTSTGGNGSCQLAPDAACNVETEAVVYTLEQHGVNTGIDIDRLLAVSSWLQRRLGIAVHSRIHQAGARPTHRESRISA